MYLDIIVLIIIFLSILGGLKNGMFASFLSLFGVFINLFVSQKFTPVVMKMLNFTTDKNYLIIYIIIFWLIYVLSSMIIGFFKKIASKQGKGLISCVIGGTIGFFKGVIIALIFLFVCNFATRYSKQMEQQWVDSRSSNIFSNLTYSYEKYIPKSLKIELQKLHYDKLIKKYLE